MDSSAKLVKFFSSRLRIDPLVLTKDCDGSNIAVLCSDWYGFDRCQEFEDFCCVWSESRKRQDQIAGFQVDAQQSLVVAELECDASRSAIVCFLFEGPLPLAESAACCAIESWKLAREVDSSRLALDDSAIQLAQSFEEQNWLRSFARSASSFKSVGSAIEMATGILQPLGYLLRAEDVFLLVCPEEAERSGLADAKYGRSNFSIQTIRQLLADLGVDGVSNPVVRNNANFRTADGLVNSLIVVSAGNQDTSLGQLVGINRSGNNHSDGMPVYDPEFGSGEVGLLEEAAVLLTTQAHNIHLLVQSNQLFLGTLHAMSSSIDARDQYTQGHSERVARLTFELAKIWGMSDEACQEVYLAGILHDIGKIGVPDSVLLKNGPLDDEEFKIIQKHPEIGYRILEQVGHLQFVLPGVLHHHERWDGGGYPHRLAGNSIPLMARLMAVADAFDAMTSSRPYRQAMPISKATHIIRSGAGQQWDALAVECFDVWFAGIDCQAIVSPCQSIIPQDSPAQFLTQAVMTLCR